MFNGLSVSLIIFQLFLTALMVVLVNSFGSIKKGYVTIDQLLSTTNLGYNLFYRILSPVVFISLTTIVLYELKLSSLTKDIWLVSIYYFGYNFIALVIMRKLELVNKLLYFVIVFSSIFLSYWVYTSTLQHGLSNILPESGGLRTEFWLIIIGYFYSLLNNFSPDYNVEYIRKSKFFRKRYAELSRKYESYLLPAFKTDNFLRTIFYSIMVTEDINRPPLIRFGERLLFFTGKIKTTGVMQITNRKALSDKESIGLAQKIILASYKKHFNTQDDEYLIASKIAMDYNAGGYGSTVMENYSTLKGIV